MAHTTYNRFRVYYTVRCPSQYVTPSTGSGYISCNITDCYLDFVAFDWDNQLSGCVDRRYSFENAMRMTYYGISGAATYWDQSCKTAYLAGETAGADHSGDGYTHSTGTSGAVYPMWDEPALNLMIMEDGYRDMAYEWTWTGGGTLDSNNIRPGVSNSSGIGTTYMSPLKASNYWAPYTVSKNGQTKTVARRLLTGLYTGARYRSYYDSLFINGHEYSFNPEFYVDITIGNVVPQNPNGTLNPPGVSYPDYNEAFPSTPSEAGAYISAPSTAYVGDSLTIYWGGFTTPAEYPIDGYNLERSVNGGSSYTSISSGNSSFITVSDVAGDWRNYGVKYRARAHNANGYSGYAGPTQTNIGLMAPSNVGAYVTYPAVATPGGSFTVSWGGFNSPVISRYYVEYSWDGSSWYNYTNVTTTNTTYNVAAADAGKVIYFRVRAYNSSGYSGYATGSACQLGYLQIESGTDGIVTLNYPDVHNLATPVVNMTITQHQAITNTNVKGWGVDVNYNVSWGITGDAHTGWSVMTTGMPLAGGSVNLSNTTPSLINSGWLITQRPIWFRIYGVDASNSRITNYIYKSTYSGGTYNKVPWAQAGMVAYLLDWKAKNLVQYATKYTCDEPFPVVFDAMEVNNMYGCTLMEPAKTYLAFRKPVYASETDPYWSQEVTTSPADLDALLVHDDLLDFEHNELVVIKMGEAKVKTLAYLVNGYTYPQHEVTTPTKWQAQGPVTHIISPDIENFHIEGKPHPGETIRICWDEHHFEDYAEYKLWMSTDSWATESLLYTGTNEYYDYTIPLTTPWYSKMQFKIQEVSRP